MLVMLFCISTQICYVFIEQVMKLTVIQYHAMSVGRCLKLKMLFAFIGGVSMKVCISS